MDPWIHTGSGQQLLGSRLMHACINGVGHSNGWVERERDSPAIGQGMPLPSMGSSPSLSLSRLLLLLADVMENGSAADTGWCCWRDCYNK